MSAPKCPPIKETLEQWYADARPAPSAEPERIDIPTTWGVPGFRVELRFLRDVLSRVGLAIVKASDVAEASGRIEELEQMQIAYKEDVLKLRQELSRARADVPSAEARKVLEAMSAVPEDSLKSGIGYGTWGVVCRSELARRAKETKTDG